MIHIFPRYCVLCLFLVVMTGCVTTGKLPLVITEPTSVSHDIWGRFSAVSSTAESTASPFRGAATLYYAGKEGSQRVSVYFWGNGTPVSPYPLRLDLMAGVGNVMAKVHETQQMFVAYVPRENTAYVHEGGRKNFVAFGLPLPFSLADLSLLITGQYVPLFLGSRDGQSVIPTPKIIAETATTTTFYLPDARLPGTLEIDTSGLPIRWTDTNDKGWRMTIEYWPESTKTTPYRIQMTSLDGAEATVVMREVATPPPFSPSQLALPLPPGTLMRVLQAE